MMQTIELVLPTSNATVAFYLPVKDRCRLVSAVASVNTNCSADATAKISVGKGTDYVLELAMNKAIGTAVASTVADTTEDHKLQIFGPTEPIKINCTSAVANTIFCLQLTVDPFLIGKHTAIATT